MPLIVTLNNCAHINIARANSVSLLSVTLDELSDPIRDGERPMMQRLKWLLREHLAAGGLLTRAAVRAYLLDKDVT